MLSNAASQAFLPFSSCQGRRLRDDVDVKLREGDFHLMLGEDLHDPVADGRGGVRGGPDVRPVTEYEVQRAVRKIHEQDEGLRPPYNLRDGLRHFNQQPFHELGIGPVSHGARCARCASS